MQRKFGIGIVLVLLLTVSAFAARLPTVNSDNGEWGTVLNTFLQVAHDSGGNIKNDYITSGMIVNGAIAATDIAASAVNTTHILDATIGSIDIPADVINATHLSAVSTLIFGHCTRDIPSFAATVVANDTITNATAAGNCTINGASTGNAVIVTPAYNGEGLNKMNSNLTVNGAAIVGSNLSINFTRTGDATAIVPQASLVRFNYIVYVNGSG